MARRRIPDWRLCIAPTAIIIGPPELCQRLERQLELLDDRPVSLGWIITGMRDTDVIADIASPEAPLLGTINDLESLIEKHHPGIALLTLPAVMTDLIISIRTRLRKLGVPDRFMPTLEDQIEGVGPRTYIDIDLAKLIDREPLAIDEQALRSVIENKAVLITGAGGSIGSELARIASRFNPSKLLLMDRSESTLFDIDRQIARNAPGLARRAILQDVVQVAGTMRRFEQYQPQVIFHAAAHKHVPMMEDHPGQAIDNNLFGTKSVADAAHAIGAERFVMISTDKAVNPSSIMGATKRLAELYIQHINRESKTAFSMVRFGNVLGSSGSVLETWSKQIADGGPVTVTDPRMTRYFMTIPEAAALVIQSASLVDENVEHGEVFLLDMGEPVNVLEMARRFITLHGLQPQQVGEHDPKSGAGGIEILITGARPGEKLHESLAFDAETMKPTRHPDINIWMLSTPDHRYIGEVLKTLHPDHRSGDPGEVAKAIRDLIPEMSEPIAA